MVFVERPVSDPHRIARRWLRRAAFALAVVPGASPAFDSLGPSLLSRTAECGTAFNDGANAGSKCLGRLAADEVLIAGAARAAEERGRQAFGGNFRVVERLTFAPAEGRSLGGDLDIVLPFASETDPVGGLTEPGALFLQQGVTRWTDGRGARRNDVRLGAVRRFSVSEADPSGIFGVSTFVQRNLEHGHTRFVVGTDYLGSWGRGSLNLFVPATGWRPADNGYSERALAGAELGLHLDLTRTLSLETAAGRWEDADGLNGLSTRGRMGIGFRPHRWVNAGLAWDRSGTGRDSGSIHLALTVPLGGTRKPPRWVGLGLAGPRANAAPDPWRPVEHVGAIEVARRDTGSAGRLAGGAEVRILEDSVGSGGNIRLQVTLPAPAPRDMRLIVSLVPGTDGNPAVPGEDYVDEPIEVVIAEGQTRSAIVSVRLLLNPDMTSVRTLGAAVALAD